MRVVCGQGDGDARSGTRRRGRAGTESGKRAGQRRARGAGAASAHGGMWVPAGVGTDAGGAGDGWLLVVGLGRVEAGAGSGWWGRLAGAMLGRSTRIDVSAPAVVERIRQLSRLETVDYSIDKIVEGERQSLMLPNFLVGDKMLLVAHGEVIAGVDLGQLKEGDVAVNGDTVRVRLPKAQVLTTGSITGGRRCIRGRQGCWWRPIRTWSRRSGRRRKNRLRRRP